MIGGHRDSNKEMVGEHGDDMDWTSCAALTRLHLSLSLSLSLQGVCTATWGKNLARPRKRTTMGNVLDPMFTGPSLLKGRFWDHVLTKLMIV